MDGQQDARPSSNGSAPRYEPPVFGYQAQETAKDDATTKDEDADAVGELSPAPPANKTAAIEKKPSARGGKLDAERRISDLSDNAATVVRKKRPSVMDRMLRRTTTGDSDPTSLASPRAETVPSATSPPAQPKKLNVKLPWAKEGGGELPPFLRAAADAKKIEKVSAEAKAAAQAAKPKEAPVKSDSGAKKTITFTAETSSAPRKLKGTGAREGSNGEALSSGSPGLRNSRVDRARSQGKYKSTSEGIFNKQLSESEQAFMPGDLLIRLGESAGQMPPAPSMFVGQGAVLFVDVSGFTALGEYYRAELVPVKASEKLAEIIRKVLCLLAKCCLDGGGEVGKFAGDALLCVWDNKDLDKASRMAQHAAVRMLIELEEHNKMERTTLQIHGGIARGSILHFHLGSPDDDLRTYLIAGEAVAAATQLVDVAMPGEFCVLESVAKGLPHIEYVASAATETKGGKASPASSVASVEKKKPDPRKPFSKTSMSDGDALDEGDGLFSSFRRPDGPPALRSAGSNASVASNATTASAAGGGGGGGDAPRPKTLKRGNQELRTKFLSKSDHVDAPASPATNNDVVLAVLRDGLPSECNVYIPVSLRGKMEDFEERAGEMRRRVAILFVELEDLRLTESELESRTIDDKKLDALNQAFVNMTRITHLFGGEVRDMLFDDKGCIFISCFGAHTWEEIEDNRWTNGAVKTAMAISVEVPRARLGVTQGTCFVGMAGVPERRTDFVVIGHDVNMAARYMAAADPGQVLVSRGVMSATEQIKYGPEIKKMIGKGKRAKEHTVFSPDAAQARMPEFQAQYKRQMQAGTLFVGRKAELQAVEQTVNKIAAGRSGVIVIDAPAGRGKSSLVVRARKMGRGRIKVVSGHALATERGTPYYAFRHLLEAYTGIRPSMTQQEARLIVERMEEGKNGERINIAALSRILPWVGAAARPGETVEAAGGGTSVEHVCDTLLKIVRFAHTGSSVQASMFMIEDVQWMDYDSLELLTLFLDGTDKVQRICIFLTFRSDADGGAAFDAVQESAMSSEEGAPPPAHVEKERREKVTELWTKLRKFKFNSLQLSLQLLPKNETIELACKLLNGEVNDVSAGKVWDASKGDPFHVEMLCYWLQQENYVRSEKSGQLSITQDVATFPKTANELIKARVGSLPPDAQRVLQLGSSGGEHFDAAYVLALHKTLASAEHKVAAELSTTQINDYLKLASDKNLVIHREDKTIKDDALSKWSFRHDLVYRSVWLSVDAQRRTTIDKLAGVERTKLNKRLRSLGDES